MIVPVNNINFARAITLIEWAEFALYNNVASLIFNDSTCKAGFLVLGLGFLLRPIGSIVFMRVNKIFAIKISFLLMTTASFMFVIAPLQNSQIFFYWILLCRFIQSFALGIGHGPGYIIVYDKHTSRGNFDVNYPISLVQVGLFIGFLCGDILSCVSRLIFNITNISFMLWRLPFIISGLVSSVYYFLVFNTNSKQKAIEIQDEQYPAPLSIGLICKSLLVFLVVSLEMVTIYLIYVYIQESKPSSIPENVYRIFWIIHKLAVIQLLPPTAKLTDKINRHMIRNYPVLLLLGMLLLTMVKFLDHWPNMFLVILSLIVMLLCYSSYIAWVVDRFRYNERYVVGVIFNCASIVFGGPLAYLICTVGKKILFLYICIGMVSLLLTSVYESLSKKT